MLLSHVRTSRLFRPLLLIFLLLSVAVLLSGCSKTITVNCLPPVCQTPGCTTTCYIGNGNVGPIVVPVSLLKSSSATSANLAEVNLNLLTATRLKMSDMTVPSQAVLHVTDAVSGTEQIFVVALHVVTDPAVVAGLNAAFPPPPGEYWSVMGADREEVATLADQLPTGPVYLSSDAGYTVFGGVPISETVVTEYDPLRQRWLSPQIKSTIPGQVTLTPANLMMTRPGAVVILQHALHNSDIIPHQYDLSALSQQGYIYTFAAADQPSVPLTRTPLVYPGAKLRLVVRTAIPYPLGGSPLIVEAVSLTATTVEAPGIRGTTTDELYIYTQPVFLPWIETRRP